VDTETDPEHCGGCDASCGLVGSWSCEAGACVDERMWRGVVVVDDEADDVATSDVAMDGAGNAVVVWNQQGATTLDLWANRRVAGVGFEGGERIEMDDTGDAREARVGMDAAGDAVAVWHQITAQSDPIYNVLSNRYLEGVGWQAAETIQQDTTVPTSGARIAMNASGDAMAVWARPDGIYSSISGNTYSKGNGWDGESLVETMNSEASYPSVAVGPSGDRMVVWRWYGGGEWNMLGRYYDGNLWSGIVEFDADTGHGSVPDVAVDDAGNAIAVWIQPDGQMPAEVRVWANRYVPGNGWGTAVQLKDSTGNADVPRIAMDPLGNATVVWRGVYGGATVGDVWAARYEEGQAWQTAILIDDGTGEIYGRDVAMDDGGDAVVVWVQDDGVARSVYTRRYDAVSGWNGSQPELLETNDGDAQYPSVAMDPSGNAVVVWRQFDGVRWNLLANVFE